MRISKLKLLSLFTVLLPMMITQGADKDSDSHKMKKHKYRSESSISRDEHRKPKEIIKLLGVEQGMTIADLSSGMGYYTELLRRKVGTDGKVIAHNTPFLINRFPKNYKEGGPWDQRFASKKWQVNVSKMVSDLDAFKVSEPVDAALMVLFYHDTIWQETDRAKMNKAIFQAIKPGGHYLIIDHSAETGSGERDAKTLHRVDKELVIQEVTAAGFELIEDSKILSHPEDKRDYMIFRDYKTKRDRTDRFVLKFKRPE